MDKYPETVYISIGLTCDTGVLLKEKGLRNISMPFDWITTRDYNAPYKKNSNRTVYKPYLFCHGFCFVSKVLNLKNDSNIIEDFVKNYFRIENFNDIGVNNMIHNDGTQFPHISRKEPWLFPDETDLETVIRRIKRFKDYIDNVKNIILVYGISEVVCSENPVSIFTSCKLPTLDSLYESIKKYREIRKYNTFLITINCVLTVPNIDSNHIKLVTADNILHFLEKTNLDIIINCNSNNIVKPFLKDNITNILSKNDKKLFFMV